MKFASKTLLISSLAFSLCSSFAGGPDIAAMVQSKGPNDSNFVIYNYTGYTFAINNINWYDNQLRQRGDNPRVLPQGSPQAPSSSPFYLQYPSSVVVCLQIDYSNGAPYIAYGCYSSGNISISYGSNKQLTYSITK